MNCSHTTTRETRGPITDVRLPRLCSSIQTVALRAEEGEMVVVLGVGRGSRVKQVPQHQCVSRQVTSLNELFQLDICYRKDLSSKPSVWNSRFLWP